MLLLLSFAIFQPAKSIGKPGWLNDGIIHSIAATVECDLTTALSLLSSGNPGPSFDEKPGSTYIGTEPYPLRISNNLNGSRVDSRWLDCQESITNFQKVLEELRVGSGPC